MNVDKRTVWGETVKSIFVILYKTWPEKGKKWTYLSVMFEKLHVLNVSKIVPLIMSNVVMLF